MRALSLEFFKLRRKHLFLMIALFLSVQLSWAFISTSVSMSRNPDSAGWEGIILTVASMNGLFLPIIAAVVVSRICDMEHKGNTWSILLTASLKRSRIYAAKFICASTLLLFAVLLQILAIVGFGVLHGFEQPVLSLLLTFLMLTMLTNMVVIALQQWVSFSLKNQAFSLCVGMIGGFIGMTADLFPEAVRHIFVWSYYTSLSPVAYNFVNDSVEFVSREISILLPLTLLLMGVVIYIAGNMHISRQEV